MIRSSGQCVDGGKRGGLHAARCSAASGDLLGRVRDTALVERAAHGQPDPAKRFLYGHSLGGAIAIDVATRPDLPAFAGLIVESSFTSIAAMLRTLKWGKLPGASLLVTQPFASVKKLAMLSNPMLLLHGTADRVVPHTMSDELFAAAIKVPENLKRIVKIDGASYSVHDAGTQRRNASGLRRPGRAAAAARRPRRRRQDAASTATRARLGWHPAGRTAPSQRPERAAGTDRRLRGAAAPWGRPGSARR